MTTRAHRRTPPQSPAPGRRASSPYGTGFDDQMTPLFERAHDGFGHLNLAGPVFVFRMGLGD